MNKTFFAALFAGMLAFSACENKNEDNRKAVDDYDAYVTRVEGERDKWETDTAYWTTADRDYNRMRADLDTRAADMDEETRKRMEQIEIRYDQAKSDYITAREFKKRADRETELRIAVFGAEAKADLSNVTAENIRSYYEKLVATIEKNQEAYTPDDWDYIKAWYEKLDALKNNFEGNGLSSEDNMAIAKLKIRYNAIRVPERIDAKIEQKADEHNDALEK